MNRIVVAFVLSFAALTTACEAKDLPSAKNELTLSPVPPNVKGGVRDPSIKPLPAPVARGGIPDDSVKPLPIPQNHRTGGSDDSIRPVKP